MLLARMGVGEIGHRHLMSHLDREADEERQLQAQADDHRFRAGQRRRDQRMSTSAKKNM